MCGLTVPSWGIPAEVMGDCFHLHCQAGGCDHICLTVFMDGSCTLLDMKPHPDWSLVTKPSVYTMRSCGLLFSWMRSLICDPSFACWPFSILLSQVFWQECLTETPESIWVLFPLLGLLELCQLAYLQYWVILTHPRLAPSQSASLCVFYGFVEWVEAIFDGTEVCFDLLYFLSGLQWWDV